ncbi:MAG: hypothetical protein IKO83_05100 [Oscillospiraceae bacterium]|nr:hypothetical protein [Oscillospiraceae bacterium]
MECPYLKYVDRAFFDYEFYCKVIDRKIADQNSKEKVERTCRNSRFYDCPIYKKMKG